MASYFGKLLSARSGRGVIRPPRTLFSAPPRTPVPPLPAAPLAATAVPVHKAPVTRAAPPLASPPPPPLLKPQSPPTPPVSAPVLEPAALPHRQQQPIHAQQPGERIVVTSPLPPATEGSPQETPQTPRQEHAATIRVEMPPAVVETRVEPSPVAAIRHDPPIADPKQSDPPPAPKAAAPPVQQQPPVRRENPPLVIERQRPVTLAATLPPPPPRPRDEAPKIEIGSIEVRIAPPAERRVALVAPARPQGPLSRGFFHSFGMRQG